MQVMNSNTASNSPTVKSLDSEYRRRWEIWTTSAIVYDSREINWRNIPWEKVLKVEIFVEGQHYTVEPGENFVGFIRWRWIGYQTNKNLPIDIWCVGWHDGINCFMLEVQFKDGSMEEKIYPFEQFKNHLERK